MLTQLPNSRGFRALLTIMNIFSQIPPKWIWGVKTPGHNKNSSPLSDNNLATENCEIVAVCGDANNSMFPSWQNSVLKSLIVRSEKDILNEQGFLPLICLSINPDILKLSQKRSRTSCSDDCCKTDEINGDSNESYLIRHPLIKIKYSSSNTATPIDTSEKYNTLSRPKNASSHTDTQNCLSLDILLDSALIANFSKYLWVVSFSYCSSTPYGRQLNTIEVATSFFLFSKVPPAFGQGATGHCNLDIPDLIWRRLLNSEIACLAFTPISIEALEQASNRQIQQIHRNLFLTDSPLDRRVATKWLTSIVERYSDMGFLKTLWHLANSTQTIPIAPNDMPDTMKGEKQPISSTTNPLQTPYQSTRY